MHDIINFNNANGLYFGVQDSINEFELYLLGLLRIVLFMHMAVCVDTKTTEQFL